MQTTSIEGENAFAHRCTLRKLHVTDSKNIRDQITSDKRSKRGLSNCVLCIPFILSGSPIDSDLEIKIASSSCRPKLLPRSC